ncbi:VWA domain-containing protein [Lacrimispora sp. NSJ-141]|uniref:VWA domain-containing protein n=1 Tax=Lientehia hominis TaxID=2897778 RepID=A0AAP2W8V4_9FIRM|nr:VWA domain-containing protein [Lientehia hominis]MCD2491142.1 VWA domain-containing protein [Lientehia hominis]
MGYPFSALVGNEKAKRALIYALINPDVGGVMLTGEKGTGKSTMVRGLADLDHNMKLYEVPLHTTKDRLYGCDDWESITKNGRREHIPGILEQAKGHLLYMDESNLLPDETAAGISAAAGSMVFIGTMNPEEGQVSPGFLDKFGLLVYLEGEKELRKRMQIIERRLEYEEDPQNFCDRFRDKTEMIAKNLDRARKRLHRIEITEGAKTLASELVKEAGCEGNHAELFLIQTARAAAAWGNGTMVTAAHLLEAAQYVFPHRGRHRLSEEWAEKNQENEAERKEEQKDSKKAEVPETQQETGEGYRESRAAGGNERKQEPDKNLSQEENFQEAGGVCPVNDWMKHSEKVHSANCTGRRIRADEIKGQGHTVKSRQGIPMSASDVAFGDTLLHAAFHSAGGKGAGERKMAVQIKPEDIRLKVRSGKTGCYLLFAVDASASMGANERMAAVKGIVLSLLQNSYEKRDKIAMITFQDKEARLLLEFTNSVDLAARRLTELKTKGKTPLAEGLRLSYEMMKGVLAKERAVFPVLMLITDGRATAGGKAPYEEAVCQAERFAGEAIRSIVIDTEQGYVRLGLAEQLAEAMNGYQIPMEKLTERPDIFRDILNEIR